MALTQINTTVIDGTNANVSYATNAGTATNANNLGGVAAANYALTANLPAAGFSNMQVFTSNGSFTVPSGVTKVKVTVVGGGGGGAPWDIDNSGGGGGGTAIELLTGLTPGAQFVVSVGAGGIVSGSGGTSGFGSFCTATGGVGGNTTGLGGLGSGGNLNIRGGSGAPSIGYATDNLEAGYNGGNGGSSTLGGGGRGASNTNQGAQAGGAYGGGGGGGGSGGTAGVGAAGVVIVEW